MRVDAEPLVDARYDPIRRPPVSHHRGARRPGGGTDREGPGDGPDSESTFDGEPPIRVRVVRDATLRERLDDAGPLIFVAAICLLLAVTLYWSDAGAGVGRLAVWVLFAALCLVAGVASVISYAISRPESEEEVVTAPKRRRSESREESPRAVRRRRPASAEVPTTPLPARRPPPANLPTPAPAPPAPVLPRASVEDLWKEFPADHEQPSTIPPPPPPRGTDATILEIDRLWSDLERLRRQPRPSASGA